MWNQYIGAEELPNTLEGVMLFRGTPADPALLTFLWLPTCQFMACFQISAVVYWKLLSLGTIAVWGWKSLCYRSCLVLCRMFSPQTPLHQSKMSPDIAIASQGTKLSPAENLWFNYNPNCRKYDSFNKTNFSINFFLWIHG